jgi:hypothetical protein
VKCDNPQVNFLTAHTRDALYVIAMNQDDREVHAAFAPDLKLIGVAPSSPCKIQLVRDNGWPREMSTSPSPLAVDISPKGISVLKLSGTDIRLPLHEFRQRGSSPQDAQTFSHVKPDDTALGEIYSAIISVEPSRRDAFVFITATDQSIRRAALRWSTGGGWSTVEKPEFPFEFSVPLPQGATRFDFTVETTDLNGTVHRSDPMTLRPVR